MSASIVVITGASRGLGLSLVKKFIQRGDEVFGISKTRRHWGGASKAVRDPKKFHLLQADLTCEYAVRRVFSSILKKAGRIDILVNNAGYGGQLRRVEEETVREFEKHFSNNLLSVFLASRQVVPLFKKRKKGWIFNISSLAGKRAVPRLAAYSVSKFGVLALSQCIARENPDAGFCCITVCPGGINTSMRSKLFGPEDAARQQSPDFVAEKIVEIVDGRLDVPSGGDIVIRHGRVTSIHPPPEA